MEHWIPRLTRHEMRDDLAGWLQPRAERLGYLGEWQQCAANAPDVLLSFQHFTDALKNTLALQVTETVVLTVTALLENRYERHQHEQLSIRMGFGRQWIAEVTALAPHAATRMSPSQLAAQRYAIAALGADARAVRRNFDGLRGHFSPAEAISIVLLIGRYWAQALGTRTLGLAPPVPSIFDNGLDTGATGADDE